jgi:uncharacterized protein DUF6468
MTTLVIEGLLILLLVITICYCFILDRRLKNLRTGQTDLRKVISDLSKTTQTAQQAISGLQATADDVDQKLSAKLHEARVLTSQLENFVSDKHMVTSPKVSATRNVPTGNSIFLRKAG